MNYIKLFESFGNVSFVDIFRYFEKKWGIKWNDMNSYLFSTEVLDYGSYTNVDINEVRINIPDYISIPNEDKSSEEFFNMTKDEWENLKGEEGEKPYSYKGEYSVKGYFLLGIYMVDHNLDEMTVLCK
jgi:hypothetical protein